MRADIFDYKRCDNEAAKQATDAVFSPGMARKRQREQSHAVNEAVQYAFENYGTQPGDMLTEEPTQDHRPAHARKANTLRRQSKSATPSLAKQQSAFGYQEAIRNVTR